MQNYVCALTFHIHLYSHLYCIAEILICIIKMNPLYCTERIQNFAHRVYEFVLCREKNVVIFEFIDTLIKVELILYFGHLNI